VLQSVALQLLQALPVPAIGLVSPSPLLEKEAKRENTRLALCWQRGQQTSSPALFIGRNSSNLSLQTGQKYS